MQLGSEPWIPDKQILEICHCRSETILLTPNPSCEACLDFTHVTARWIAQPPKAAFVTRLRPASYPTDPLVSYQINRQLSGWTLPPLATRAVGAHHRASHR